MEREAMQQNEVDERSYKAAARSIMFSMTSSLGSRTEYARYRHACGKFLLNRRRIHPICLTKELRRDFYAQAIVLLSQPIYICLLSASYVSNRSMVCRSLESLRQAITLKGDDHGKSRSLQPHVPYELLAGVQCDGAMVVHKCDPLSRQKHMYSALLWTGPQPLTLNIVKTHLQAQYRHKDSAADDLFEQRLWKQHQRGSFMVAT